MKLFRKLLNKLKGLHYSQEYLCFAHETLVHPLRAWLVTDNNITREITNSHLFVGYCPLVFAFPFHDLTHSIQIVFSNKAFQPNEKLQAKDALAELQLTVIKIQQSGLNCIAYYEGTKGSHRFQSLFRQYIGRKYNEWYNQKPGNVFLHSNLLTQVQVAYATPRLISLITVGGNGLFNLFPTDLHGQAEQTLYVISLRTGGKACQQVMASKKILLSQMQAHSYKKVYSLGKNHMQDLKPARDFLFDSIVSETYQLPVPEMAVLYRELELIEFFEYGIHTLLLFEITGQRQLRPPGDTLVHIHNSYATWRSKKGLPGNFLMR